MLLLAGQLAACQPGSQIVLSANEVIDVAEDFLVVHWASFLAAPPILASRAPSAPNGVGLTVYVAWMLRGRRSMHPQPVRADCV
jgi:hypothetical protein